MSTITTHSNGKTFIKATKKTDHYHLIKPKKTVKGIVGAIRLNEITFPKHWIGQRVIIQVQKEV